MVAGTMPGQRDNPNSKIIAVNRRARYDYAIEDELNCGIVLAGSEVKSLRTAKASIAESYVNVEGQELWLINGFIAPYVRAGMFGHEERRKRKLLVSRRELGQLWKASQREGMTLVPLVLYFDHRGMAKLRIGIAKGRKRTDKRQHIQRRDWSREQARLLKQN